MEPPVDGVSCGVEPPVGGVSLGWGLLWLGPPVGWGLLWVAILVTALPLGLLCSVEVWTLFLEAEPDLCVRLLTYS